MGPEKSGFRPFTHFYYRRACLCGFANRHHADYLPCHSRVSRRGSTALVPVYLSEMAPTKIRGTLGTLNNLMIVTGILLAYIVNYIFTPFEAWRWMVGLAAVPAALLLIGIAFMPESPRWLVKRGREQEARQVMEMTHDKEDIAVELAEMKQGEAEKKNLRSAC